MNRIRIHIALFLLVSFHGQAQKSFHAGFKSLSLVDTSRLYKPGSVKSDTLHYRPVDLDIWYPSMNNTGRKLGFGDLLSLLEQRANSYQDGRNYHGMTEELAQFYAVESGLGVRDGKQLLQAPTDSYVGLVPLSKKSPVILYMAGLNGMGFENFKILERLVAKGFIVVSIWSVGRYPGIMTNNKLDMMEQVYDAEFALRYLKLQNELSVDYDNMGILGCSWGGISGAVTANRNPEIQAVASLDGTETHYFGNSDEDDQLIQEIHDSGLLKPLKSDVNYLYLESGNKLQELIPTREYNYFKQLNSNKKFYLRFLTSKHEDFTAIPATLNSDHNAGLIHNRISEMTEKFFEMSLRKTGNFNSYFSSQALLEDVSVKMFEGVEMNAKKIVLKGTVSDIKTGARLGYVNVGVLNKELGTVSDENGIYELALRPGVANDTIRFSLIGYQSQTYLVKELIRTVTEIKLEEESRRLNAVVVTVNGLKKKNLGNRSTSKFISSGFGHDQLGAEIGIRINIRKKPTYVDQFNFHISYNRLTSEALFRLNIYEIVRGKPGKNIMTNSVFIPVKSKQTGIISTDLMPYNVVLDSDVIATLEWVKTEGVASKGEAIFFSIGVFNGGTLLKKASQAKFKKYSSMGVGMNFDVRYP